MKLDEAIAWITTEGKFDTEGHCCPKSSEAVNTLLDAVRNGAIFTFEEVVPKAFHDKCMQIEIAKRRKPERSKGKWVKLHGYVTPGGDPVWCCSECGEGIHVYGVEHGSYGAGIADHQWVACPNCGAMMEGEEDNGTD